MKRVLIITLTLLLAIVIAKPSVPTLISNSAVLPVTETTKHNYEDDTKYSNFVGRLRIPEVGVDVALYRSNKQYVVDRVDSAAYFDLSPWRGHFCIADHNTQDFGPLVDVEVGMIANIIKKDGTVAYYQCVEVFDGHNTGKYISDWGGKIVMARADLLMYTCLGYWRNVRVTLWNEIPAPEDKTQKNS